MCIGDSITGFYVEELFAQLQSDAARFHNFDFIGNANSPPQDTNGYGGYKAQDLLNASGTGTKGAQVGGLFNGDSGDLVNWMAGTAPDIVLLHIGTNDGQNVTAVLAAYSQILSAARSRNSAVRVFVAQIIPSDGNPNWAQTLNASIPGWAHSLTTAQSPIIVVDQYTGFDASIYNASTNPNGMTRDGTHPTTIRDNPNGSAGTKHMASRWVAALRPYLHSSATD